VVFNWNTVFIIERESKTPPNVKARNQIEVASALALEVAVKNAISGAIGQFQHKWRGTKLCRRLLFSFVTLDA